MKKYLLLLSVLGMSVAQTSIAAIEISHEVLTSNKVDISRNEDARQAISGLSDYAKQKESRFVSSNIDRVIRQAEQGNARAQSILATSYDLGRDGLTRNYAKAYFWHKKAANQGDVVSQYLLAGLYENGQGVRQDYSKAIYWYKKASDQKYTNAQFALGVIYLGNNSIRPNQALAKEWFGKACDNGNQNGCDFYKDLNEQGY